MNVYGRIMSNSNTLYDVPQEYLDELDRMICVFYGWDTSTCIPRREKAMLEKAFKAGYNLHATVPIEKGIYE